MFLISKFIGVNVFSTNKAMAMIKFVYVLHSPFPFYRAFKTKFCVNINKTYIYLPFE